MSLEILVYQDNGTKVPLELPEDITLSKEEYSPFFDEDLDKGSFSYPMNIPWSGRNSFAFGSPEVLASYDRKEYYEVDVIEYGVPSHNKAKLTILGYKGDFDGKHGTYIVTISGAEGIFGALIRDKSLKDLELGGLIEWTGGDSRNFAKRCTSGSFLLPQFTFPPIYWPDFFENPQDGELADDMVNHIVYSFYGIYNGYWMYGAPVSGQPDYIAPSGTADYIKHRTIPFINLHYVFKKCFEEFGYTVDGDWLDDDEYATLTLLNNCALEIYTDLNTDVNRRLDPKNHVPDIKIVDFIVRCQQAFGFGLIFDDGQQVHIKYRGKKQSNADVIDVTDKVVNYFESEPSDENKKGIRFNWKFDTYDKNVSELKKDLNLNLLRLTDNRRLDIFWAAQTLNPPPAIGDLAYSISWNSFFRFSSQFGNPYWEFEADGAVDLVIGDGEVSYMPEIAPLFERFYYFTSGSGGSDCTCCYRGPGSYYINDGTQNLTAKRQVNNDYGLRMFYYRTTGKNGGFNVPEAFSNIYKRETSTRKVRTGLHWYGPDGVYTKHHEAWTQMKRKGMKVEVEFILQPSERHIARAFDKILQIGSSYFRIIVSKPTTGGTGTIKATLLKL